MEKKVARKHVDKQAAGRKRETVGARLAARDFETLKAKVLQQDKAAMQFGWGKAQKFLSTEVGSATYKRRFAEKR